VTCNPAWGSGYLSFRTSPVTFPITDNFPANNFAGHLPKILPHIFTHTIPPDIASANFTAPPPPFPSVGKLAERHSRWSYLSVLAVRYECKPRRYVRVRQVRVQTSWVRTSTSGTSANRVGTSANRVGTYEYVRYECKPRGYVRVRHVRVQTAWVRTSTSRKDSRSSLC